VSKLIKQAGLLYAADLSRLVIKALIGFILVRLLSPADYGTYQQLFLIYSTFAVLLLLGIPQSFMYFLPKFDDSTKKNSFISQTILLLFGMGSILALLLYLFRFLIGTWFHNPSIIPLMSIFCLFPLFMFISTGYSYLMLGLQKPQKVAFFSIFSILSDAVLILTLAFWTKSLTITTMAVVLSAGIQSCFAVWQLNKVVKFRLHIDKVMLTQMLQYSLPLGLASLVGVLAIRLDKFVISSYFSPSVFALFTVGATEIPLVAILLSSVNSVLLPELSKLDFKTEQDKVIAIFGGAVRKNALIIFPMMVFFYIFATDFLVILYSKQYMAATPYFRVYLLSMPVRVITFAILLQAKAMNKQVLYCTIISLAANLILNIFFVNWIGSIGPAVATVIVFWISAFYYLWVIKNKLFLPIGQLFSLKPLLLTLIVSILSGALISPLLFWNINAWFRLPIGLLFYGIVYYFLASATHVIRDYDKQVLRGIISHRLSKFKRRQVG